MIAFYISNSDSPLKSGIKKGSRVFVNKFSRINGDSERSIFILALKEDDYEEDPLEGSQNHMHGTVSILNRDVLPREVHLVGKAYPKKMPIRKTIWEVRENSEASEFEKICLKSSINGSNIVWKRG